MNDEESNLEVTEDEREPSAPDEDLEPSAPDEDLEPSGPRALHALLRYPLVILLGVLLAGGTYYLMKKLGY